MQEVKTHSSIDRCEKCGNIMVTRVIRRDLDYNVKNFEQIQQCIVCKYWKTI